MKNTATSVSIFQSGGIGPFLPRGGPNTILVKMLESALFGISRSELIVSQASEVPYTLARTGLSYLLSNSLIEEQSVDLYRSHFGSASRALYFTTVRGFNFLRSYAELARLAGTLGEAQREIEQFTSSP